MDIEQTLDIALIVLVFVFPLALFFGTWLVGARIEAGHFASIRKREAETADLPVVPIRTPEPGRVVAEARLVTGSVVVSSDHFKRVVAGLRMIFGGRLRVYESLMDRARREAVLRMKAEWPRADAILNLRIETSAVSEVNTEKSGGAFEVLAYGTAIRYE